MLEIVLEVLCKYMLYDDWTFRPVGLVEAGTEAM